MAEASNFERDKVWERLLNKPKTPSPPKVRTLPSPILRSASVGLTGKSGNKGKTLNKKKVRIADSDAESTPNNGTYSNVASRKKKKYVNNTIETTSGSEADTDLPPAERETPFTVVANRKRNKYKGPEKAPPVVSPRINASKLNSWKKEIPPDLFILKPSADKSVDKCSLWAEICKKVKNPKFLGNRVLQRGDVEISTKDPQTSEALRQLTAERVDLNEVTKRWPTVIIHDVERDIPKADIAVVIATQNEKLNDLAI